MSEQPMLKKSLGWGQGTAMAIGSVLGSGILILPAVTAQSAGPASLVAWVVMSILAFPLAHTLGRLASQVPDAGGIAAYARKAFGARAGRLTGWLFLGTIPIGVPIVALVGANYVGSVFQLGHLGVTALAAGLLLCSLLLNARGVEVSARVQVLMICVIALLLLAAVAAAAPHVKTGVFHPFAPHGWVPVGASATMVFWCFVGWEMVASMAEEFRNPQRDVVLCLGLAAVVVGILYISLAAVTVGTEAYRPKMGLAPLSILVGQAFGYIGTDVTAFIALLVTFVGVHGNIAGFSRIVYAQAREGDFPKVFAKLHPVYQTPITSFIGLGTVFTVVLGINGCFHPNLGSLIQWPSIIFLVLYMIAMASALKLLSRRESGWWAALATLGVCVVLYPFSGWACLYPPVLLAIGWVFNRRAMRGVRKDRTSHRSGLSV